MKTTKWANITEYSFVATDYTSNSEALNARNEFAKALRTERKIIVVYNNTARKRKDLLIDKYRDYRGTVYMVVASN